ncbi:MAG TPA: multicopper oxidase domain-containing protein [Candidatus Baltobacteraceae bacterium]|nr:multicopper oxidase domain-containing protein [Candidatus Baltobacteraceae bacterium]
MRVYAYYAGTLLLAAVAVTALAAAPKDNSGHVRTYYIAADEVVWNYAPGGQNAMMNMPYTKIERAYTVRGKNEIGPKYWKAVYREYTDGTFKHLKTRAANQRYLGILGPIMHAEVGDTIKVVFKNNATHAYSIHPHGVFYTKANEGSAYEDGSSGASKTAGAVPPGHTYTYTWEVPERAGPGPSDPSSVVWFYHSHTEDQRDVDSGLVGAMIVTARGMARPDGTPNDVDREFVVDYEMFNENQSWYLDRNMHAFTPQLSAKSKLEALDFDEDDGAASLTGHGFVDGNLKFTINGYLYGEGPMMTMRRGERVRWYVISLGNGFNEHTPHWHGNTVLFQGHRTDVLNIGAAQMLEADMVPDNPGTWLFHCHFSDHMAAGMLSFYKVI